MYAPLSAIQINYLKPLQKWRILSLKDLREVCGFESSYVSFARMILRLEKRQFIESFYDPFNRRKYIYLTREGSKYVDGAENKPSISKDTLVHDAAVVRIILEFMHRNYFYGFELEHEFSRDTYNTAEFKVCPDAMLFGEKKEKKFRMAFELELNRKSKQKYLNKAELYLKSNLFDYALYFFHDEGILNSYRQAVESKFGVETNQKILWALNPSLLGKEFSIQKTQVFFKGEVAPLESIFG